MSQYYDLEKTSQVLNLSTAEVNRLREQGKIQGFRDGSNWKFKREDVDKYLTQWIKTNSESGEFIPPGDDDDSSLFEKDDDMATPAGDDFLNMTFDDDELPSLLDSSGTSKVSASQPERVQVSGQSSSSSGISITEDDFVLDSNEVAGADLDDNKIEIDNDLDILSLAIDDDLSLDMGGNDGLSLVSDDDNVVLGGKKKEPPQKTDEQISLDTSSSLSLASDSDESGFLLDLADDATEAAPSPIVAPVVDSTEADDEVFTLDDASEDKEEGYALALDDEPYALADDTPKAEKIDLAKTENINLAKNDIESPQSEESSFSLADDEPVAQSQPVASSSEIDLGGDDNDDGIFQLADDPAAPEPAKTPTAVETAAQVADEDFQLDPIAASLEESDSESASQVIAVDDDNLFLSEDDPNNMFANVPDSQSTEDPSVSTDAFVPMDAAPGFPEAASADGFGEPMAAPGGFQDASSGGLEFDDQAVSSAVPVVVTEGCSYNAGKGCAREARYSGLEVLLLLVPSLIILIPSAMAVYELIRVIWSWGEPFPLSGTILETVGNLVSLINK